MRLPSVTTCPLTGSVARGVALRDRDVVEADLLREPLRERLAVATHQRRRGGGERR